MEYVFIVSPNVWVSSRLKAFCLLVPQFYFLLNVERVAQRAIEYPLVKHEPSRQGADVENKISQVEDIVPGTDL